MLQESPMATSQIGRIIGVTSCKGGVGKSTVAFELARRLAGRGRRVGIFDADVHGPSLPTQLGEDKRATPTKDGWRMAPVEAGDMKLMSFGFIGELWDSEADIDPRGAGGAGELAVQLLHTTDWGRLDDLIIDTPPGTGEIPRALAARAHYSGCVVVTTPSELAVADVVRGVSMLRKFNIPILGVVENMATFASDCGKIYRPFGDGSVNEVLAVVDDPSVRAVALPISKEDKAALGPSLDPLLDRLPADATVELPQLDWHEKPHWPDKLFFAGRGHERRHAADAKFAITPPRYDRMD